MTGFLSRQPNPIIANFHAITETQFTYIYSLCSPFCYPLPGSFCITLSADFLAWRVVLCTSDPMLLARLLLGFAESLRDRLCSSDWMDEAYSAIDFLLGGLQRSSSVIADFSSKLSAPYGKNIRASCRSKSPSFIFGVLLRGTRTLSLLGRGVLSLGGSTSSLWVGPGVVGCDSSFATI